MLCLKCGMIGQTKFRREYVIHESFSFFFFFLPTILLIFSKTKKKMFFRHSIQKPKLSNGSKISGFLNGHVLEVLLAQTSAKVLLLVLMKGQKGQCCTSSSRELLFPVPFLSVSYGSPVVLPVEL